jgi:DNA-binding transcriptional MerR regulator
MADPSGSGEAPRRALFKSSEVCDLVKVQPYVLRSWETEFPELGVSKTEGGPRLYRREDVERVMRIKHLLVVEGLTLAGARRRLEDESAAAADAPPLDDIIGQNARERITEVKRGLRGILDLLAARTIGAGIPEADAAAPEMPAVSEAMPRAKSTGKANGAAPRRKRSA